jgi:iron complex transport system permease protein
MSGPNLVVRLRQPPVSARVSRRGLIVCAILLVAIATAICLTVAFGEYPLSVWGVMKALVGVGSHGAVVVVRILRLPRVLEGALVGGSFALSGAIFQLLTRNGLVAPDIIGVNEGAAVVAVALILTGAPPSGLPILTFAGGMTAATIVYLAALRKGRLNPYRLVLVGIAVNASLGAVLSYLLTRAAATNIQALVVAQQWLLGSVYSATWHNVHVLTPVLGIGVVLAVLLGRRLEIMALGDDTARSVGLTLERSRLALVALGVALAATAVAYAGPIGFVAFVAPHIGRRLARTNGVASLPVSLCVGALLVVVADYVAKRVLEPTQLPVGILTSMLGAPYFLFLLYRTGRQGTVL